MFFPCRLHFCLHELNRHEDQRAVFGREASDVEAEMKAENQSASLHKHHPVPAQPFGMSPERERTQQPTKENIGNADDRSAERALKMDQTQLSQVRSLNGG